MQKHGIDIPFAEPMNFSADTRLLKILRKWAKYLIFIVMIISLSVWIGWLVKPVFFIRPSDGSTPMNPLTAMCFLLYCFAFLVFSTWPNNNQRRRLGVMLTLFFISFPIIRLGGLLLKWDWEIDKIFFTNEVEIAKSRLAASTAICFLFSGVSMFLSGQGSRGKQTLAELFAIVVFLFALFALLGHIYDVPEFNGSLPFLAMSIQSIVCFLLGSLSILFLHAGEGIFKELASTDSGGVTFRKLIFYALVIPIIIGILLLLGSWAGWFSTELGVALIVISVIVVFIPMLWYNTVLLNKRDRQRTMTEKKFELLLDAAPDATVVVNEKGAIQLINRQVENLFGYTRAELIGQPVEILIPHDVREKHVYHRSGFFKEAGIRPMGVGIELKAIKKDQSLFPVEISLSPIATHEGLLVSASIRDITDRKKAEEKFRSLLDAAPDATIIVNHKGFIEMINHQTENLFGYQRDELIGKPVEFLIPENVRTQHVQHRADYIKAPKVRAMGAGIELHAIKKDGTKFPVEISLSPLRTEEGLLISASVRDITARKELENELRKSTAEMEAFTYSVSHDLRAPLRGIIGFTNMLEEDYSAKLDDEARRITSVIKNNTLKMGHLIDDLLAFSRMGKKEIIKTKIDTMVLVKEIINEMSVQNNNKRVRWNLGSLQTIHADINTLRQVWINLISNAIKYSAKKDEQCIDIGSTAQGKETVFYVKDNGVGFDESYKHKLFKVFQRLHSAEEFEGTGVGLALVEKIISRHGGKVWAEGKPDEGACFYFSLPSGQ